jgi:hypothetical protein
MRRVLSAIMMSAALGTGSAVFAGPPTPAVAYPEVSYVPAVGCFEGRYPFDAPDSWLHGYFQETPAHAGFHAFRPYNYKHVFAQSQIAAEWGGSSTAPYSHQFGRLNSQAK